MTKTAEEMAKDAAIAYARDAFGMRPRDESTPAYSEDEHEPEFIETVDDFKAGYLAGHDAGAPRWIKCSERMPEPGHWVLIQGPYHNQPERFWDVACYACYNKGVFVPDTEQIDGDYEVIPFPEVTHWMPLPAAPEVGEI